MADGATGVTKVPSVQMFGTFLGVYTPSVLTILGLIMYLRLGWVVGNVGLPITLLIVLLASAITCITALSASAIATNMRVGVGGEYYMIAHSLGLEMGGAIGIPLFLCRTLSITFYSFGLAEAILSLLPDGGRELPTYTIQLLSAIIIIAIVAVAGKSATLVLRLQIAIMAAVGLSLVALFIGAVSGGFRTPELVPTYRTAPEGFWYVFAIFFPAVTGFTAGIGMSGDLKDPRRSIPRGTLLAVLTGAIIYILVPFLLAVSMRISPEELAQSGSPWIPVALLGAWLVFPGVWGAILSSAFGSALGGPRVLQALARDGLAPRFLGRVSPTGQPRVATWISGLIALAAVALGGLNAVAQFVTILFLTLYVTINVSAAVEKLVGDPSYRPTINVPWYVSLLGSAGAISVMFLISPYACIAAVGLELLLYIYLRRHSLQTHWGDVRAGIWAALARFALLKLHLYHRDPRNWRPLILLFSGNPDKRIGLVRLASWFNQNRGIVTAYQLILGDLEQEEVDIEAIRRGMNHALAREGLAAFSEVGVVPDFERGVIDVAQANGIAGLQSNTVMFGWPEKHGRLESMLRIMRAISHTGRSTIIARLNGLDHHEMHRDIVLWWRSKEQNGDLMLLLAYLLSLNPEWKGARIVVRSIVDSEDERLAMKTGLEALVPETRIQAKIEVVLKPADSTIIDTIHRYSANADIVFLGLSDPDPGAETEYADKIERLVKGLNTTVFVRNAGEFAGHLI